MQTFYFLWETKRRWCHKTSFAAAAGLAAVQNACGLGIKGKTNVTQPAWNTTNARTPFLRLFSSLSLSFFQRSRKRYRMPKPWNRPEGFGLEATKILESQTSSDAALTLSLSFPSFSSLFSVVFFFHLTMHSILSFRTSTNYNTGLLRSRKEPGFIAKSNRRAEIRNYFPVGA